MNRSFNISEWALAHRPFVWFLVIIIVAAGGLSYLRLGRNEDPNFTIKTMVVQVIWPGASIADTLQQITDRVEKKLQETPGLDYIRSYTVAGTACGLATYIDRQLAGSFGSGARTYMDGPWQPGKPQQGYQLSLDPKSFFSAGAVAPQAACQVAMGKKFQDLSPPERDSFLLSLSEGEIGSARVPLAQWFNELLYPLFEQACFADPIYGGNRDKVFWKMAGYPGLPAFNTLNVMEFRGRPFPAAKQPQSIQDFS
jgi:hypothetical protein